MEENLILRKKEGFDRGLYKYKFIELYYTYKFIELYYTYKFIELYYLMEEKSLGKL